MGQKIHRYHVEKDAIDGSKHIIDASTPRSKLSDISKYKNSGASGAVGIGVSGSPATIQSLSPDPEFTNLIPLTIKATPSGLGTAETATFHVIATLDDGTTAEIATRTTAAGSTATETITQADYDFTVVGDGRRITRIDVTAESSATATTATADVTITALEA